jgi:putative mRNA 3-end processing factor
MRDLLTRDQDGLFCAAGGFHIDPARPVPIAVFTGEHRRVPGCGTVVEGPRTFGEVRVSMHPSGFAPGSVQVRVEAGEVWVVTGDFTRARDPFGRDFESLACDVLVLPARFGLPIFRWEDVGEVGAWLDAHESCTLFASPVLALRIQAELGRPIRRDPGLDVLAKRWEELGAKLPPSDPSSKRLLASHPGPPPASRGEGARRRAIVAGAARIRGTRRRQSYDRGFGISEHADWPMLLRTVEESRARRVLVEGDHAAPFARFLAEARGLQASVL